MVPKLRKKRCFEPATTYIENFWGLGIPPYILLSPDYIISLFNDGWAGVPTLCWTSPNNLDAARVYKQTLKIMQILAQSLSIEDPNIYKESEDFFIRASQKEIMAVVQSEDVSVANHLQALVKDDAALNPMSRVSRVIKTSSKHSFEVYRVLPKPS